jgi:tetratricopeptide (TPR) repeat protein
MVSAIRDRLLGLTRRVDGDKSDSFRSATATQILPYFFLIVSVLSAVFVITAVALGYGAEYYNRRYLLAVGRNDGNGALNSEVKALSYNPNLDVYQRSLGQLSLGIAANISSRPNVTDSDRQTISNLIQESIRRARIVSELIEPASVANWEARAQIYQNLIGVAQNAEQWAVDSYARAISLDPVNPNLRILLGGIYFGLKNYELAANSFSQAASLKQDSANAHYNLAQALLALNRRGDALNEYNLVLNLIGTSSTDYPQALKERDSLAKLVDEENKKAAEAANTVANPPTGTTNQERLSAPPPTSNLQKKNVDNLNLGKVEEASPAASQ